MRRGLPVCLWGIGRGDMDDLTDADWQDLATSDYHAMLVSTSADGSALLSSLRLGLTKPRKSVSRIAACRSLQGVPC
jgi:hypothetical protein